jgi:hypothetical protein
MRKRNKQLWRRTKAIGRNLLRCAPAPNDREHQLRRIRRKCDRLWEALNSAMVTYFTTGETPHGLDDFLKENGLV